MARSRSVWDRSPLPLLLILLLTSCCCCCWGAVRRFPLSEPGTGKPCAAGCAAKGNCNIEDGRCECAIGMTGPTCEDFSMQSCQASSNDLPFWGVFGPKNCACYKQAADFFSCTRGKQKDCQVAMYQAKLSGARCYQFEGKPAAQQWSDFPPEGAPGVTWHHFHEDFTLRNISEVDGRKAINLWGFDKCVVQPLASCPQSCSGRGTCIMGCFPNDNPPRAAWCECHKGFKGPVCEHVDWRACSNKCSGRGNCSRGFCHCEPPWFGLDCSRSKGFPARPENIPTRQRPVVYMYELPQSVSSPIELDDNLPDFVDIYSSYLHFLEIFLNDWAVRTEDPWEANLFYIPAFTYSYSSNVGDPAPHLRHVLRYIKETYPFYNRTGGRDHFLWFTGDHGSCEAPPDVGDIIRLVHFGYHANQRIQGPSIMGRQPKDPVNGCYLPARDIVAAPYNDVGHKDSKRTYEEILLANGQAPHRVNLFFFAGGVRSHNPLYSGGVRQLISKMLTDAKNSSSEDTSDIVFIEGTTEQYQQLYNTTKFCLAPHGSGFGIRLSIAMVHGCIPVVIQDHVFQPYEDIVRYEDISVRVPKRDIPDLIPILRGISEEEQRLMRLNMAKYYQAFIWEPMHGGMAYNYTIQALFKRVNAMWGELYRRKQQ